MLKQMMENKIPDITNLDIKDALNTKFEELECRIFDITNLATKAPFNAKAADIEHIIPDTTAFFTTHELNTLTKVSFNARIKQEVKELISKNEADAALDIGYKIREKKSSKV